jgi:hypothetical protein
MIFKLKIDIRSIIHYLLILSNAAKGTLLNTTPPSLKVNIARMARKIPRTQRTTRVLQERSVFERVTKSLEGLWDWGPRGADGTEEHPGWVWHRHGRGQQVDEGVRGGHVTAPDEAPTSGRHIRRTFETDELKPTVLIRQP